MSKRPGDVVDAWWCDVHSAVHEGDAAWFSDVHLTSMTQLQVAVASEDLFVVEQTYPHLGWGPVSVHERRESAEQWGEANTTKRLRGEYRIRVAVYTGPPDG